VVGRQPDAVFDRARHGGGRCKDGAQMKSPLDRRAGQTWCYFCKLTVGVAAPADS
jgi:hypothetical protein